MKLNKKQYSVFNQILDGLNLKKDDKVHLSLDLMKVYATLAIKQINFFEFSKIILNLVLKKIGKNGILAIPVFNFSCIKTGKFNRKNTKGETGSFGNLLLKKYYKNRSRNPINSFLIFGKMGEKYIKMKYKNTHGRNSLWEKFIKENFKLITIGHHYVRSFTVIHYLERLAKINYRFDKKVKIKYEDIKNKKLEEYIFFARKLNICDNSTITFKCDEFFLKKRIAISYRYKKLISFYVNYKLASSILLKNLKKNKPDLVSYTNKRKKINYVLDNFNVAKLEERYLK